MDRAHSAPYANSGPDLGQGRLGAPHQKGFNKMELRYPHPPEKMRLAAHITPKYDLRGPDSLKFGPGRKRTLANYYVGGDRYDGREGPPCAGGRMRW